MMPAKNKPPPQKLMAVFQVNLG